MDYTATRDRVEDYFDRSATKVWERLTSDAPVSGVRATVRAGRDQMRGLMLAQLPEDLTGLRILDAGCGPGMATIELARRGATVVGADISPALIEIAQKRLPTDLAEQVTWHAGDMLDPALGTFDHVFAMDSMIYYGSEDIARHLSDLSARVRGKIVFTLPPRTPLLMAMFRVGKLFPRADRSPQMVPQNVSDVCRAMRKAGELCHVSQVGRVKSGFYISTAMVCEGAA